MLQYLQFHSCLVLKLLLISNQFNCYYLPSLVVLAFYSLPKTALA